MRESDRCPYCLAALSASFEGQPELVVHCQACGTPHHLACFLEHGRCTLFGCGGRETRTTPPRPQRPGSLSPFTPLGTPRIRRPPGFLSVRREPRLRTRARRTLLQLHAPERVAVDEPLELFLELTAPAPLRGHGLRLRVDSLLDGASPRLLMSEEAVLVGGPRRDWFTRLKLRRSRTRTLLEAGRHRFHLRLETKRLLWRGGTPGVDVDPQRLRITAVLEARGAPAAPPACVVLLLDGRTAPPVLDAAPVPVEVEVPGLPARRRGWSARPVVGSDPTLPLALAAARYRALGGSQNVADALELEAEAVTDGGRVRVVGELQLDLRHGLRGELVLVVEAERSVDTRWRSHGRETVLLARAGPGDRGGRHGLAFDYPPPTAFHAGYTQKRRLSVHAELRGEGRPLRSSPCRLVLPARRPGRADLD